MTEANAAVIGRFYEELWNRWDLAVADEILAPALRFRGTLGTSCAGIDAFKRYVEQVRFAFPDWYSRIDEVITAGEKVVARMTWSGTHRGDLLLPGTSDGASRTRTDDLLGAIQERAIAKPAPGAALWPFQSAKYPPTPAVIRGFRGWDALHPQNDRRLSATAAAWRRSECCLPGEAKLCSPLIGGRRFWFRPGRQARAARCRGVFEVLPAVRVGGRW